MLITIPQRIPRRHFFRELDHGFKDPYARQALVAYWHQRPELIYFILCCLHFASDELPDEMAPLGKDLLRGLVANDCGVYHFCKEWCRLAEEDEQTDTVLRCTLQEPMRELDGGLRDGCRQYAQSKRPPRPSSPMHNCCAAEADASDLEELYALAGRRVARSARSGRSPRPHLAA